MKVNMLIQVGRGEQGEGEVGGEAESSEEDEGAGGRDCSSGFHFKLSFSNCYGVKGLG